ncbi:MAG: glycosyltransferase family 4 protein [Planctomycetota bacterium]|nr:glycosyltransferase family 4 protein [Planctomycetota bacterium]
MRRLCYICEATQGGVRKHLRDLLRVFSQPQERYDVHAILGDRGEPGFREELEQLRAARASFRYTFVPELKRAIRPLRDWRAYVRIKELLRDIRPDIVHTHSSKAGILGRHAAHHLGIRDVIHTAHVFPFQWAGGARGGVFLALERQAARFCRALVCVGESQRADALARGLTDARKLVVIRNGVELPAPAEGGAEAQRRTARATLELPEGKLAVGMVARLAPQKGVGAFVQAAALVQKKRPDAAFFVVGGGPLEDQVRARMAEAGLRPESLRLLGHREDAAALYPAFDVVALSSLYEGLPYVLLEAMAWGVPIVATDVLGSRDVVADGETGFLARVDDPADIADRLLRLLDDGGLRARCGAAARKRVAEQFSFAAFVEGHRRLYRGEG